MNQTTRIRAITIQQPWLWAILELGKRIENRTWKPSRDALAPGEWLALHASKTYDTEGSLVIRAELDVCVPSKAALPRGGVVAVARYLGAIDASAKRAKLDRWFVGPFGLELDDVIALPRPVACRGELGLWDLTPEVLAEVREGARAARRASGAARVPPPLSSNCGALTIHPPSGGVGA